MKTYKTLSIVAITAAVCAIAASSHAQGECCQSKTAPAEQGHCSACKMDKEGAHAGEAESHGGKHPGKAGGHMAVMQGAHTLINNNRSIERKVIEIPGGVRTITTSSDPALVATLQKHPREMGEHLEEGGHVRRWDPVFAELAKHQSKVKMVYKNLENGVEVTSTSEDEAVTALIRAHAKKVSEFVKRGRGAMHEPTPLPEGYTAPEDTTHQHH